MTTVFYGQKIAMGEAYVGSTRVAATKIALYPMTVTQLKSEQTDAYKSVQVGFGTPKKHSRRKFAKFREIPAIDGLELGATINPMSIIQLGSVCQVQGTSKGKGFAGVVKRWNFAGGPRTHGQSDRHRAPGSIGQGTTPGRVHKGKKMAGHMGSETVTVNKAVVVSVGDDNTIWVTGPVPGARRSLVCLTVVAKQELEPLTYISGGLVSANSPSETRPEATPTTKVENQTESPEVTTSNKE